MTATDPLDVEALREAAVLEISALVTTYVSRVSPGSTVSATDLVTDTSPILTPLLDALAAAHAEIERLKAERTELWAERIAERDAIGEKAWGEGYDATVIKDGIMVARFPAVNPYRKVGGSE